MSKESALSLVFILLATAFSPTGVFATVPPGKSEFVARDREKNLEKIKTGIELAIADMSFIIRPFARLKLKAARFDVGRVTFDVKRGAISIRHDGHMTTSPSSGKRVRISENGEAIWLSQKVGTNRVTQIFELDSGELELVYVFGKNKETVTIHATLSSEKLPAPLKYHLVFDRARTVTNIP